MAVAVVIDEDPGMPAVIGHLLGSDHTVIGYPEGGQAVDFVREHDPDVVFLDLDLSGGDGLELLGALSLRVAAPPIVAFCSQAPPRRVVDAVRRGACDVIAEPLRAEELHASFLRALSCERFQGRSRQRTAVPELVGMSPAIVRVRDEIARLADAHVPVMIGGESGVGKELVARAIHRLSARSRGPFQARNCGALPDALFESELFGTERGAFTDAVRRPGALELSHGGTLFLDEIGDLSVAAQVKLLRALEGSRYYRVGGTSEIESDVRLISATNRDLRTAMTRKRFRHDLYYRINVLRIDVPPLRTRREDIPLLVEWFHRDLVGRGMHGSVQGFAADALAALSQHDWPGNVRELRNVVTRAVLGARGPIVRAADLQFD